MHHFPFIFHGTQAGFICWYGQEKCEEKSGLRRAEARANSTFQPHVYRLLLQMSLGRTQFFIIITLIFPFSLLLSLHGTRAGKYCRAREIHQQCLFYYLFLCLLLQSFCPLLHITIFLNLLCPYVLMELEPLLKRPSLKYNILVSDAPDFFI